MNFIKIKLFSRNKLTFPTIWLLVLTLLVCKGCTADAPETADQPSAGQIYLYGEAHGNDNIYAAELEKWDYYYNEQQMRHLFVELPYYTAEFLNIWIQEENDDILDALYNDWQGTATYDSNVREFYRQIKRDYPETIFHGTDLGHQRNSTGQRYLEYLQAQGLEDSENWRLAQENIAQGKHFYDNNGDMTYREDMMTANFIREFDKLDGTDIMGIYGAAHTWLGDADSNNCMASRLQTRYGAALQSEDLSYLALDDIEPIRLDTLNINGQNYQAAYFGEQDLRDILPQYNCRRFWRIENAYADFADYPTNGDILPYNNYPMLVEPNNVYLVEYESVEGKTNRLYYRANGHTWQGMPATEGIDIE